MSDYDTEILLKKAELIYDFIQNGADSLDRIYEYEGERMTMVQIHTLVMIDENPGICVWKAAEMWGHTMGAASRNVDRLKNAGFLEKKKLPGNNKEVRLFVTEKGKRAADLHRQQDKLTIERIVGKAMEKHSKEDICRFFSVLDTINDLIKDTDL